ncbi:MAG: AAA-like domain-containing protein [Crocosphaera sp.]
MGLKKRFSDLIKLMGVEQALIIADQVVYQYTGKHLTSVQREIIRGVWLEETYEVIATKCFCSEAHVKTVGKLLWDLLSKNFGEKVTKKTFSSFLERRKELEITQKKSIVSESKTIPNVTLDLEFPDGQITLDSPFYVERPSVETISYETILKPGSLIRIKAPQRMGKTSLMVRLLHYADKHNHQSVILDFKLADTKFFEDLGLFLKWVCVTVGKKLNLPNKINDYWDDLFGSKTSCTEYFEQYILTQSDRPLVLALEDVDIIFSYPNLAEDFFSLLRAWHEEGKNNEIWQRLNLLLVHSTEVYIPLNLNQSPFNVGLAIELPEFTPQQVLDLARLYGLNWDQDQVNKLMAMLGGHPYLIRVALYYFATTDITLRQFLQEAPTESGCFGNYLRRHQSYLNKQEELAKGIQKVISSSEPIRLESLTMFKLHSLGLVTFQGNKITPRCELYRQYFAKS